MRNHLTLRHVAAAVAGAVLVGLFANQAAQAITDSVFRYSSPKTGFYTIPSAALVPKSHLHAANYSNSATTGGLTTSAGGDPCFIAGVNLPNGVSLTAMRVWYMSAGNGDPEVSLHAQALGMSTSEGIAITNINDDSMLLRAANASVTPHKVNNARNAYALQVCLADSDFFFAARITYTYETAGD